MKIYPKLSIDEKYWLQLMQKVSFPIHLSYKSKIEHILEALVSKGILDTCIKNNKTYYYVK